MLLKVFPKTFLLMALVWLAAMRTLTLADEPATKGTFTEPSAGLPADPLEPFVPAKPIDDAEKAKVEAKKFFVLGVSQLDQRNVLAAKRSFEKALSLDPDNVAVLKELVPLALQLNDVAAGMKYCERAVALDPKDFRLLHLLAGRQAEVGKLVDSVKLLEQARQVEGVLKEDPRLYIQIRSDLAQHLETLGRNEEAISPLQELLHLSENSSAPGITEFTKRFLDRRKFMDYEQLGRSLAKAGRFDEAIATLDKARSSEDRGKRLSLVIAEVSFDRGDFARAAKELEIYAALGSQNRAALDLYAKTLEKLARSKDLVPQVSRWLEADRDNPVLREFYAERLIDAGEFQAAQAELDRLRGRAATVPLTIRLYRKMNDPKKLLDAFIDVVRGTDRTDTIAEQIKATTEDQELLDALAKAAREVNGPDQKAYYASYVVAKLATMAKNGPMAIEFLTRCLGDKKAPPDPNLYEELITLLWENKKFEEILSVADQAEKAIPQFRSTFVEYRSRALESLGRTDEAIALLDQLVKESKSPEETISTRLAIARLQMQREKFDEAITICRSVEDQFPNSQQLPYVRYILATVLSQKGDIAEFEKTMLSLIQESEGIRGDFLATLHNDLGYTWAEHDKNLDQAEVMIRKALEAKPDEPAYLDSLGWVLFKLERYEQAAESLRKATDSPKGQDAVIYDHLGDVYLKLNKKVEAGRAWEKARELLTENKTTKARQQREQIEKKMQLLQDSSSASSTPSP
ncbi:tetratricopeptide repeat protein [bacterium]|nr:tetratricopeptide repeat protein [bacterium]